MNRQKPPTSPQPQVGQHRIHGSTPVKPLDGAANQSQVIPSKVYGGKVLSIIGVRLKSSDNDRELIVNESDFDPDRHERQE